MLRGSLHRLLRKMCVMSMRKQDGVVVDDRMSCKASSSMYRRRSRRHQKWRGNMHTDMHAAQATSSFLSRPSSCCSFVLYLSNTRTVEAITRRSSTLAARHAHPFLSFLHSPEHLPSPYGLPGLSALHLEPVQDDDYTQDRPDLDPGGLRCAFRAYKVRRDSL